MRRYSYNDNGGGGRHRVRSFALLSHLFNRGGIAFPTPAAAAAAAAAAKEKGKYPEHLLGRKSGFSNLSANRAAAAAAAAGTE